MSALYTVAPNLFAGHGWWKVMLGDAIQDTLVAHRNAIFATLKLCPACPQKPLPGSAKPETA